MAENSQRTYAVGLQQNVRWESYVQTLLGRDGRPFRHSFAHGALEVAQPLSAHQWMKCLIRKVVWGLSMRLRIPIVSVGSPWLRDEIKEVGLNADEAFHIANSRQAWQSLRRGGEIDESLPPDLVIEVHIPETSLNRSALLAALGVQELWCESEGQVKFFSLERDGVYHAISHSIAFPNLKAETLTTLLARRHNECETSLIQDSIDQLA